MLDFFSKYKNSNTQKETKAIVKNSLSKNTKLFSGESYTTYGTFEVGSTLVQLTNLPTEKSFPFKLSR
mgnify:CR=1 FL=1